MLKLRHVLYTYRLFSAREQKLFILLISLGFVGFLGIAADVYRGVTVLTPDYGGRLIEGVVGRPTNLNPVLPPQNDADLDLRALIHASLLTIDHAGNLQPQLAESLPNVSDDLKTYTIKLKPNLKWQDGKPITAEDVTYTIKNVQNKGTGSYLRYSFKFVKAEPIDDLTIEFKLKDPSAAFSENLLIGLLPQHLNGLYDNLSPLGAGPYKLKKFQYGPDRAITGAELIANEYYQPHRPYISKITLKFYDKAEDLKRAYETGDIKNLGKLANGVNADPNSNSNDLKINLPQYQAVFFNQGKNDILKSLRVRQALTLATDREEIIKNVYGGKAISIGGPVVGDLSVPPPTFSLDTARDLLNQEGWQIREDGWRYKSNRQLQIVLATNEISSNIKAAQILRSQWEQIGVKLEVLPNPNLNFFENVLSPRNYEAVLLFENTGHDPDPYSFWHSSQITDPGLNFAGVRNAEVDKTIIEARSTTDIERRQQLYAKFIDLINSESPAVFLAQPYYLYIADKNIKNIKIDRLVVPQERFSNIHEWYISSGRRFKL